MSKLPMNAGGVPGRNMLAVGLSHEQKFVPWLGELLKPNQVSMVETFVSIQGEGELLGVRSLFIRTSQCNLRCSWCDTKYSFSPKPGARHGLEDGHYILSIDDLLNEIKDTGVTHVVLTGGEPTVQPYFSELVLAMKAEQIHVTVETNATIIHHDVLDEVDMWSLAPKLNDGSNMTYDAEVMLEYLKAYDPDRGNVQVKWVSTTEPDIEEAFSLLNTWRHIIEGELPPVWFHPNGMVPDELYPKTCKWLAENVLDRLNNAPWAAELQQRCLVKVGLQYHRLMWGQSMGT